MKKNTKNTVVLFFNEIVDDNTREKHNESFPMSQEHTNGSVKIIFGCMIEHINIRRLMPYFKQKQQHPFHDNLFEMYKDGSDNISL